MTDVEKQLLQALPRSSFYLYYPPFFHANTEICGEELHAGLVLRWSTFIIVVSACGPSSILSHLQPEIKNLTLFSEMKSIPIYMFCNCLEDYDNIHQTAPIAISF